MPSVARGLLWVLPCVVGCAAIVGLDEEFVVGDTSASPGGGSGTAAGSAGTVGTSSAGGTGG
ncbi:MAG: hypothetical protein JRI23_28995, partial [Deltaproteobacteria bacterium]|nr:hypothetical protein [Deltaproteobacteria bacterium]MBW2536166.1 hypothetical protein [Deltaproteobacteria bacterium]